MTTSDITRFVQTLADETLTTRARRVPFKVHVNGSGLAYTLSSSGRTRPESARALEKVIARYLETQSLRPSDYLEQSFNASYTLAVLQRLIVAQRDNRPPDDGLFAEPLASKSTV